MIFLPIIINNTEKENEIIKIVKSSYVDNTCKNN